MILFVNATANPAFQYWTDFHTNGYLIACDRWPTEASEMKLHRVSCPDRPRMLVGAYSKACSEDRQELVDWAKRTVHGDFSMCLHCNP